MVTLRRLVNRIRTLWSEERGASLLTFAAFAAFVLVPILGLAIEMGRYAMVRGKLQDAADAAALAAVREVDVSAWRENGQIVFLPSAYAEANAYVYQNLSDLAARGIRIQSVQVSLDGRNGLVTVTCRARVSGILPAVIPTVTIVERGTAQVAWLSK
jgi:Flp pilus assembly protein TadG